MITLTSLQGTGAFTVQYQGQAFHLRPGDVDRIVTSMNDDVCRAYHLAARRQDTATAQHIFMDAAALFYAAPAAPVVSLPQPQSPQRRKRMTAYAV